MKLNHFVRKHIIRRNSPEPAHAPTGDPAPSLDNDAPGGGGSDSIDAIAGLIGAHDAPEQAPEAGEAGDEPPAPGADPEPQPDPAPESSELEKLRARVAELEGQQAKPEPEPAKPASTFLKSASEATTPEQLAAHEDYCERMRDWALQNWDGASVQGDDGNTIEFTSEQVRQQFARFDNELRKAIPARHAALQQRATAAEQRKAVEADAVKAYPWIAKPETEDGALYAKFSKALPAIAELPAGPMAIADMIAGFRARTRRVTPPAVSPTARTTPRPPAVPKPAATGGAPAGHLDAAKALDLLRASGGDRRSVADVLLGTGLVGPRG